MFVARDRDGELWLYRDEPNRNLDEGIWACRNFGALCELNPTLFPDLDWKDSPIAVTITKE